MWFNLFKKKKKNTELEDLILKRLDDLKLFESEFEKPKRHVVSLKESKSFSFDLSLNLTPELESKIKKYTYLRLWYGDKNNEVYVFTPDSVGGSGNLGVVPPEFKKDVKNYLLNKENFGVSGPSIENYSAIIESKTNEWIRIKVELYSNKEHKLRIEELRNDQAIKLGVELDKKYVMNNPVTLNFHKMNTRIHDKSKLKLSIKDKEYYLKHLDDFSIELIEKGVVIAKTHAQKAKVLRIVKAYYNQQYLDFQVVKADDLKIEVLIS